MPAIANPPDLEPHVPYMDLVDDALTAAGCPPTSWWTESSDGMKLDSVFIFDDSAEWPDGVLLGWDQHAGWSMVSTGQSRTTYDLGLNTYANPLAVAAVVAQQLKGTTPEPVENSWDGAETLAQNVARWEAS